MKTKLDVYLAVQTAAQETLGKKHEVAEAKITELLKPFTPAERERFSQVFWSRRQTMLTLQSEPVEFAGK